MKFLSKTLRNQKGQGMMEYVLIAIVVGLIVLFIAAKFGGTLTNRFGAAKRLRPRPRATRPRRARGARSAGAPWETRLPTAIPEGRKQWRRQRGAAMLEYVLLAIVVILAALFLAYRFSGSVAGRWSASSDQVKTARVAAEAPHAAPQAEGQTEGGGAGGGSAQGGGGPDNIPSAGEPEPTPIASVAGSDGKVRVGNFTFDFSTIIWLGLAVVVVAVMITMQMFRAAKAKPKVDVNL